MTQPRPPLQNSRNTCNTRLAVTLLAHMLPWNTCQRKTVVCFVTFFTF